MLEWHFILDPGTPEEMIIDEPTNFSDTEFEMIRDPKYHGVSVVFSTRDFKFQGRAADRLREKKEADGVDATAILRIEAYCADTTVEPAYSEDFSLNFAEWNEECGRECYVSLPIEHRGCVQIFNNRFDTKVDVDAAKTLDQTTAVYPLADFPRSLTLRPKTIIRQVAGTVAEGGDTIDLRDYGVVISGAIQNMRFRCRPTYANEQFNAISTGQLIPGYAYYYHGDNVQDNPGATVITPQLLYEEGLDCFTNGFTVKFRKKGRVTAYSNWKAGIGWEYRVTARAFVGEWENWTLIKEWPINLNWWPKDNDGQVGNTLEFDTGDQQFFLPNIPEGKAVWVFLEVSRWQYTLMSFDNFKVVFDKETFIDISAPATCSESNSVAYPVFETLSRLADSISDGCVQLESAFYGRTDSSPKTYPTDGEGSLKILTNGLRIRRAPNAKYFLSLKECMEGLQPIDNIGFVVEPHPTAVGRAVLRVEDTAWFFRDEEVLRLLEVANVTEKSKSNEYYGTINIGYEKWEAEDVNSLDELLSQREYRPNIRNSKGRVDVLSKMIASGYIIELCRTAGNFANGAGADTKWDNDTFVICVSRPTFEQATVSFSKDEASGLSFIRFQPKPAWMDKGATFTISGSQFNDGEYEVVLPMPVTGTAWVSPAIAQDEGPVAVGVAPGATGGFQVEYGNIEGAENVIAPDTLYNYRISPVRNLLRWFKNFGGMFVDAANAEKAKFIFAAGKGNYKAKGLMKSALHRKEKAVLSEDSEVTLEKFAAKGQAMPLFTPDSISFEHPLSIAEFQKLRANPYGYITYQCDTGEMKKAYISRLKYKLGKGTASFEFKKKYE